MKRFIIALMLILPIIASAQNDTSKQPTKYEDLMSKSRNICTTHTYDLGHIELPAEISNYKIGFNIINKIISNNSYTFLEMSHITFFGSSAIKGSSAIIEVSAAKELLKAINDIKQVKDNPSPEGAKTKYSYLGSDGILITYNDGEWKIELDRYTTDCAFTKDIDIFINKLQEAIQKMETIN